MGLAVRARESLRFNNGTAKRGAKILRLSSEIGPCAGTSCQDMATRQVPSQVVAAKTSPAPATMASAPRNQASCPAGVRQVQICPQSELAPDLPNPPNQNSG